MMPRSFVPASLIPLLDPSLWFAGGLAAVLAVLVLRWQAPELRRLLGTLIRLALALLGIGVLLELQRRGWIGAPVRSWPGLLTWAAVSGVLAHGALWLLERLRARQRG